MSGIQFHGAMRPPFKRLPSGRPVIDTGKVVIGLRSGGRYHQQSDDAATIQRALLTKEPSMGYVSNRAKDRAQRFMRRLVQWLLSRSAL